MALTGKPRNRGIYDDKLLFETYMGWGAAATYKKLRGFAKENGMFNQKTGEVSHMGVFWSVWRYALEHPHEAYPLYKQWWFDTDPQKYEPTFKDFLEDIQNHAYDRTSIASDTKYKDFCEAFSLDPLPPKIRIKLGQEDGWKCPSCQRINPAAATYCGERHPWRVGCQMPKPLEENTVLREEAERPETNRDYAEYFLEKVKNTDGLPTPRLLKLTGDAIDLVRSEEETEDDEH